VLQILSERRINAMDDQIKFLYQGHRYQWFGPSSYSQHGEDLFLLGTFNRLGIHKPSYLDIGAHHPTIISNTALLYSRGSRGINVDANPEHMEDFRRERPEDINLNVGVAPDRGELTFYRFSGETAGRSSFSKKDIDALTAQYPNMRPEEVKVKTFTLNDVVDQYSAGIFPDLLCIDIEFLDAAVLETADFSKSRPKVICTELFNSPGEKEPEIYHILATKGFARYSRCGSNVIFLDQPFLRLMW
jgi:FkbM family methyltransferase